MRCVLFSKINTPSVCVLSFQFPFNLDHISRQLTRGVRYYSSPCGDPHRTHQPQFSGGAHPSVGLEDPGVVGEQGLQGVPQQVDEEQPEARGEQDGTQHHLGLHGHVAPLWCNTGQVTGQAIHKHTHTQTRSQLY